MAKKKQKSQASSPISFFKKAFAELKKVQWPTRQEVTKMTLIVVAISILVGAYIGALDYLFLWLTRQVVG